VDAGGFGFEKELVEASGRAKDGVAVYQVEPGRIRTAWFHLDLQQPCRNSGDVAWSAAALLV
jgi:hypothetical protein